MDTPYPGQAVERSNVDTLNPCHLQVNIMKIQKNFRAQILVKRINAIRSTKQTLYAAAARHTIAPLLLLACVGIPLMSSTHG